MFFQTRNHWDADNQGGTFFLNFMFNYPQKNIVKSRFQDRLSRDAEEKLRVFLRTMIFQALDFEITSETSSRQV